MTPTHAADGPATAQAAGPAVHAGTRAPAVHAGWQPDVLGDGFEARTLPLPDDDEGEVVATLVRALPAGDPRPPRAVVYLHGWNDYFFQRPLAQFWTGSGAAFYALDLRKHGRSLRPHQTPNYVDDLAAYDADMAAALDVVRGDLGPAARVMLVGHSTGGLVAALWARRHPGRVAGLVLNSPWLELTGSTLMRALSTPVVAGLARAQPKAPVLTADPGFYARSLLRRHGGEWEYDEAWRPTPYFPVRPGWLQAVLTGHATVARGLDLDVPVLVAVARTSLTGPRWREDMRRADVVLDTDLVARRAVMLGDVVTVVRIPDGIHDLALSAPHARARFYSEVSRWSTTYGWR